MSRHTPMELRLLTQEIKTMKLDAKGQTLETWTFSTVAPFHYNIILMYHLELMMFVTGRNLLQLLIHYK